MWLFIEATDVWLFRDGRPFDSGADHRAVSMFPPSPTTIQGAIRSKLLALYGIPFTDYASGKNINSKVIDQIGMANTTTGNYRRGKMRLRGPFLAMRQLDGSIMPYFKTPADLLQADKKGVLKRLIPLTPTAQSPFAANWPSEQPELQPCLYDDTLLEYHDETSQQIQKAKTSRSNSWISAVAMQAYLNGRISTENCQPPNHIREPKQRKAWYIEKEQKLNSCDKVIGHVHLKSANKLFHEDYQLGIGIESDDKRTSDGKLYTVTYRRPHKDVGLLVEVNGLDEAKWPPTGILSLGGKRKSAQYTRIDKPAHWPTNAPDGNKLYLATPTQFDGGWQTKEWGRYFSNDPQLIAALVDRPLLLGGWDMAQNRPKPMQRYVTIGCIYFFDRALKIKTVPICDDEGAGQIGFGATFIGRK